MNITYLSLGSNVGDRMANVQEAIRRLREIATVTEISSMYETEPMEIRHQPEFLNCAVAVETGYFAREFLGQTLAIEKFMGRQRTGFKGPRVIDIDIVLFGDTVIQTSELVVPHPTMHQRRFVLEPLAEIAAHVRHPVLDLTVLELLHALPQDAGLVRRV